MSKLVRMTSLTVASSALAASFYYYATADNGYYYRNSHWKKVSDQVRDIIDGKEVPTLHRETPEWLEPFAKTSKEVVVRYKGQMMRDMWNAEVRRCVAWLYSLGQ